jgi:hypothetical protein
MKTSSRNLTITIFSILSQIFAPYAFAADTAVATLNISGDVPTIFSVSARGMPGDLDLSPSVSVNNRLLGIMHFRYNVNVSSIKIASSTASGVPENATAVAYGFGGAGFKVAFTAAGCSSVDATYNTPFPLVSGAGTDVKSAGSAALTAGVEEDCSLTASWAGTAATLPLAGKYSMVITLTMISI